jgi:hypothetical protein
MVTPGVSFVISRKLRPLLGRSDIASSPMRVAPSVRAVSMSGASAVTTSSSLTAACESFMSTTRVWPTPRSTPVTFCDAKPSSVARTSYGPSGSSTPR